MDYRNNIVNLSGNSKALYHLNDTIVGTQNIIN